MTFQPAGEPFDGGPVVTRDAFAVKQLSPIYDEAGVTAEEAERVRPNRRPAITRNRTTVPWIKRKAIRWWSDLKNLFYIVSHPTVLLNFCRRSTGGESNGTADSRRADCKRQNASCDTAAQVEKKGSRWGLKDLFLWGFGRRWKNQDTLTKPSRTVTSNEAKTKHEENDVSWRNRELTTPDETPTVLRGYTASNKRAGKRLPPAAWYASWHMRSVKASTTISVAWWWRFWKFPQKTTATTRGRDDEKYWKQYEHYYPYDNSERLDWLDSLLFNYTSGLPERGQYPRQRWRFSNKQKQGTPSPMLPPLCPTCWNTFHRHFCHYTHCREGYDTITDPPNGTAGLRFRISVSPNRKNWNSDCLTVKPTP